MAWLDFHITSVKNFPFVLKTFVGALVLVLTQIRSGSTNCSPPCVVYATTKTVNVYALKEFSNKAIVNNAVLAVSLDIDYLTNRVYWCDLGKRYIFRVFLNGTSNEIVVQNAGKCEGLAVEWASRLLYWTNSYHKRIEVSHLDGANRSVVITTGLEKPRAIAVDPTSRFIFWTDWGTFPKIERATLSGENRQVLISTGLLYPNGLVVDHTSDPKRLYWTDVHEHNILSTNLDGGNKKIILKSSTNNQRHPFGITILYSQIYYTDWRSGSIHIVRKKNGTSIATIKTEASGNIRTIMDIVMYDKSRQPKVTNGCTVNNGGCSNLCLPNPNGIRCSCPDGIHLNADGKTCSKLKDFLIFADKDLRAIYTIPTDTTTQIAQPIISHIKHPVQEPVAVEYDPNEDRIYWTDTGRGTISRAFLTGNGFEVLHNVDKPQGLSIDKNARRIYWTDSDRKCIQVSHLDGSFPKVLIKQSHRSSPMDIHVDSINGFIYWTEWGNISTLRRTTLDGSSQVVLIDKDIRFPSGITVDAINQVLYWTDYYYSHIGSYHITTKTIEILHKEEIGWVRLQQYMKHPVGIAIYSDSLYWTDWTTNSIYVAKTGTGSGAKRLVALLGKPADVVASSGQITVRNLSPRIICPADYEIYNKNKYTSSTSKVKLPTLVEGSSSNMTTSITCSPTNITRSNYGDHTVTCDARSQSGNTDTCSYRLWIKDHRCQRLRAPINGKVICKSYCTVICNEDFVLAEGLTKTMSCFGRRWKPLENNKIVAFPVCLQTKFPTAIEVRSSIVISKDCKDIDTQEMVNKFQEKLRDVLLKDEEAKGILVVITIKNVSLQCFEKTKSWLVLTFAKINFVLYLNLSENHINSERIIHPRKTVNEIKDILFKRVNDGTFTLVVSKEEIKAKRDSYKGVDTVFCKKNEIVMVTYYCITCSFGMFYNQTSKDCELCPFGYYQDKEEQTSCIKCPNETSTVVMGTDTSLGCYGGTDILTVITLQNYKTKPTDLQMGMVKELTALLINQYCDEKRKSCLEEETNYHPPMMIDPSDVIIPDNYPIKISRDSYKVGMFVVISIKHDQPVFFTKEVLSHIILLNIEKFKHVSTRVSTTVERTKKRENKNLEIILPSVLGFLILCPLCAYLCIRYRDRVRQTLRRLNLPRPFTNGTPNAAIDFE